MADFLHGIEHVNVASDVVPVNDIVTAVIGLVGTADKGDTNVLTLCKSAADDAAFGTQGTIPEALKAIRMQDSTAGSALVFVVKVKDATAEITGADIVGTISETGERTGLKLFETAGNKYGFEPMIYIAPRYSALDAVKQELIVITEKPRRWHISTRQTAGASPKLSSRAVRRVILPRSRRGRNSFSLTSLFPTRSTIRTPRRLGKDTSRCRCRPMRRDCGPRSI